MPSKHNEPHKSHITRAPNITPTPSPGEAQRGERQGVPRQRGARGGALDGRPKGRSAARGAGAGEGEGACAWNVLEMLPDGEAHAAVAAAQRAAQLGGAPACSSPLAPSKHRSNHILRSTHTGRVQDALSAVRREGSAVAAERDALEREARALRVSNSRLPA